MRRLILIFVLSATVEINAQSTLTACTGSPCPTLVQHVSYGGAAGQTYTTMKFHLPNPTLGGSQSQGDTTNNLLICGVSWDTAATATFSDNKSNSWVDGPTSSDGTRKIALKYVLGVAAGTQDLTLTLSAAEYNIHFECSEFYNVATSSAVDGTATSTSGTTGPTIPAGSITTTTNNDLIYYYAIDDGWLCCTAVSAWQVGNGFNLLSADRHLGHAAQYAVWGSNGAINPTMMAQQGTHDTFGAAAIAFKAATAGTAPSAGIRIKCLAHTSLNAAAYKTQFACPGANLIVTATAENTSQNSITSVTDDDSNAYTKISVGSDYPQMFYAANATLTNNNSRIMTFNNANSGVTAIALIYGITGADTSPLGATATAAPPDQKAAGGANCPGAAGSDTDHSPDITTTRANSLVIAAENNGTGPECGLRGTGYVLDSTWYNGQDDSSTGLLESSSGYGHIYASSVATYDFHWDWANATLSGATPMAAEFKAPIAVSRGKRVVVTR
jgi:hypothetical protein